MESKTNRNKYINCEKIEKLRIEKGYSISYMNNNVLQLASRNTWRRKCNSEVAFSVEELVLLANLFNVSITELLINKGRI